MLPVAILAGGLGTRLAPLTQARPKALVEINGEPFLAHQLRLLSGSGITHAVLCVGYLGDQIREFAGDGRRFGLRLEYSFDGPVLQGTAGALRAALSLLGGEFFVLYGDSYLPCDYAAVERAFRACRRLGLMAVYRNEGLWDASNVEFTAGRLLAYDKKNRTTRMHHIDYGLGVLRGEALERVPAGQPYDLAALYQDLLAAGQLAGLEVGQRFYEVGSADGMQELADYLATQ